MKKLKLPTDWSSLRRDEKLFVLRVYTSGGKKYAAEPYRSLDGEVSLWARPKEFGYIENVGSYKFNITGKFIDLFKKQLGVE